MSYNFGVIIWLKEDYSSLIPDESTGLYSGPGSKSVFGWSKTKTDLTYFKEGLLDSGGFSFDNRARTESYPQPEEWTTTEGRVVIEDFVDYLETNNIKIEGSRVQFGEVSDTSFMPLWTGTIKQALNVDNFSSTLEIDHISKQRNVSISRLMEDKSYSYPINFGKIDKAVYKKDMDTIEYIKDDIDGDISLFGTSEISTDEDLEERFEELPRLDMITTTDLDSYTASDYSLIQLDGEKIKRIYPISNWVKNTTGSYSWQIYLDESAFDGEDGVPEIEVIDQVDTAPTIFKIGKVTKTYASDFYSITTELDGKLYTYKGGYIPFDSSYVKGKNVDDGQNIELYDLDLAGTDKVNAIIAQPVNNILPADTTIGSLPGLDVPAFPDDLGEGVFQFGTPDSDWSVSSSGSITNVVDQDQSTDFEIDIDFVKSGALEDEVYLIIGYEIDLPELGFEYDNLYLGLNSQFRSLNIDGNSYVLNTVLSYKNDFYKKNLKTYTTPNTEAPATFDATSYNIPKTYFGGASVKSDDKYVIPLNKYDLNLLVEGHVIRHYGHKLYPLDGLVESMLKKSQLIFAQELIIQDVDTTSFTQKFIEVAVIAAINDIDISENIYRDNFLNDRCEALPNKRTTGNRILKHIANLQDFSSDYVGVPPEGWGFNESSNGLVSSDYDAIEYNDIYRGQLTDLSKQTVLEVRKLIMSISHVGCGVDGSGVDHFRNAAALNTSNQVESHMFDDDPSGEQNIDKVLSFKRMDNNHIKPYINMKSDKNFASNAYIENVEFTNLEQLSFDSDYVIGTNTNDPVLLDIQWTTLKQIYDKYKVIGKRNIQTNLEIPDGYISAIERYLGLGIAANEPYYTQFTVPYKWISDKLKADPTSYFGCYAGITFKHSDYGNVEFKGFISEINYSVGGDSDMVTIKARIYKPSNINIWDETGIAPDQANETGIAPNQANEGAQ